MERLIELIKAEKQLQLKLMEDNTPAEVSKLKTEQVDMLVEMVNIQHQQIENLKRQIK